MTGMRDTPAVFAFAPVRSFLTDSVCVREDQALPTKLTTTVHREVVSVQISRNNEEVGQQHSEQLTAAFLTEQLGNLRLRVTFRRVIGEHTVLDLPACASSDVLVQGQQHAAMHCNTLQHTATHCNTLQHTSTHGNTPQHTVTHLNTRQQTTTHGNTLQTRHPHRPLICARANSHTRKENICLEIVCRLVTLVRRGGGLGSRPIFKKFNEPYAPS